MKLSSKMWILRYFYEFKVKPFLRISPEPLANSEENSILRWDIKFGICQIITLHLANKTTVWFLLQRTKLNTTEFIYIQLIVILSIILNCCKACSLPCIIVIQWWLFSVMLCYDWHLSWVMTCCTGILPPPLANIRRSYKIMNASLLMFPFIGRNMRIKDWPKRDWYIYKEIVLKRTLFLKYFKSGS